MQDRTTGVTLAAAKDAALLCDYVVPIGVAAFGAAVVRGHLLTATATLDDLPHEGVITDLLPPPLRSRPPYLVVNALEAFVRSTATVAGGWHATLTQPALAEELARLNSTPGPTTLPGGNPMPDLLAQNVGWIRYLTQLDADGYLALFFAPTDGDGPEAPCITLRGLRLVDTTRVSWEQILDVREQPDRVARLRGLRALVTDSFQGKSRAQVQDEIEARVESYEQAAKLMGLPLKEAALHAIAGEKAALQFAGSMVAAVLSGQPLDVSAAIAGLTLIPRLGFEVWKRRHQVATVRRTDPIGYLIELRQLESTDEPV